MPESTTSKDVGGLSGQTQESTTPSVGNGPTTPKPEGMTDEEWQDVQRRQQGVEVGDTPDTGTAQSR